MAKGKRIDHDQLVGIIEQQVAQAIGHENGQLSFDRAREFAYYYGLPFGNEVEGESQVISTDVADTVEGILPSILRIFTASDDAVRFDPNGPEDEEQAAQQTEVANYIFYRQNNGFLVLYEWFKDALIQKNGVVKYWWEDAKDRAKESYEGLTDGEYQMLLSGDGLAEIQEDKHETYPDEQEAQKRAQQLQMLQQVAQQDPRALIMLQQLMAQPPAMLHDVSVTIIRDVSKLCIQCIPPEEFGISAKHPCVSIQDTPFCYHRGRRTISELREDGCPEHLLTNIAADDRVDVSPESLVRNRFMDQQWPSVINPPDPSMREVWVTECFIRIDTDGDGVAELRHIIMPGREIWIDEETDHINFAALTPIIMPHRWVGRGVAELVMDVQFQKSTLLRQQFNNLYLTNNPQKAVLSTSGGIVHANLDDLLTSRPGGILREYMPNAIRHIETPFVAAASFPMIEYLDGVKENRTGLTRYNQGTDADSLNKTARGISLIQSAGQQRLDLIARIFAETGVKDLMKGIVYMMSKYNTKPLTLKLRNKWVNVNPREWKTMLNMTINVGLGTGNRDVQLAHLMQMHEKQVELMQTGRGYMVSDENIWNLYKKTTEAMGFKHPELFISDPEKIPAEAKKPPPDPTIVKAQMDAQEGQAKLQHATQKEQLDAKVARYQADVTAATNKYIAELKAQTDRDLEQMRIRAQAETVLFQQHHEGAVQPNHAMDHAFEEWKEKLKAAITLEVAEMANKTTLKTAQISAAAGAVSSEEDGYKTDGQVAAEKTDALMAQVGEIIQSSKAQQDQLRKDIAQALVEHQGRLQRTLQDATAAKAVPSKQNISIDNVRTDASGKIIGAQITKTVQ